MVEKEMFENFFRDRSLLPVVDAIAKRYNKTPYEVMTEMTIFEFNFNAAVLAVAVIEEKNKTKDNSKTAWGKFGIKRTVVKKPKGAE